MLDTTESGMHSRNNQSYLFYQGIIWSRQDGIGRGNRAFRQNQNLRCSSNSSRCTKNAQSAREESKQERSFSTKTIDHESLRGDSLHTLHKFPGATHPNAILSRTIVCSLPVEIPFYNVSTSTSLTRQILIIYKTLLHRIKTSPSAPFDLPSWNSSVFAS
jgi:hypothetical protein